MSEKVLVVMAHPDDGEFLCGGTLAKWAKEGKEVHYCVVTDGNHGSSDPDMTPEKLAAIRQEEHQNAARVLGAKEVYFLHYNDSMVEPNLDLRRDITRVIRTVQPDIVICQDPSMRWMEQRYINHPDHRAAGEATLAAIMPSASTRMIFPELLEEGLDPHEVREIYIGNTNTPDVWVDITESFEIKIEALRQHKSQFPEWDPSELLREMSARTAEKGRETGMDIGKYAEAYKYIRMKE